MYGLPNKGPKKFRKTPSAASNFPKKVSPYRFLDIIDVHFLEFF
uniref:Uncharacterized protein n=1 Tax=viral metagenome TaxID=1070528 RepID=A0A6C0M2S2_9ZZZZ